MPTPSMLNEVNSVVDFIAKLFLQRNLESRVVKLFADGLRNAMCNYYLDHWFPDRPCKGSAYRCIRNHNNRIDPLFIEAGLSVQLKVLDLVNILPKEITIWVDPDNVSYRIGEEGSIGVLFDGRSSVISQPEKTCRPSKLQSCKDQVFFHLQSTASRSGSEGVSAAAS